MSPKVRFVILSISLGLLTLSAVGADSAFKAGTAESYAHQSAEDVIVGAKPYDKPELTEEAFGKKTDLLRYGILPVLVVIENKGKNTLDLRNLEVNIVASDGRHAPAIGPEDLYHLGKPTKRPGIGPTSIPLPKKKNPLETPEIAVRSFTAKMLPPGDSASGFFYFEAKSEGEDKLYLNGLREARTGKELLYFEFPMNQ